MSWRNKEDVRLTHALKDCPFCTGKFLGGQLDPKFCPECGDFWYVDGVLYHWNRDNYEWEKVKPPNKKEKVVFN